MKRTNCEILFADLPVVFIDDWKSENITFEKLKYWRNELKSYFYDENKRKAALKKLTSKYMDYILNKI